MKIQEIRREVCTVEVEAVPSVLEEASEVLGYRLERTPSRRNESELRSALGELGIEPLNESDVVRYQAEMIAELMLTAEYQMERTRASVDYRFFHYWENVDLNRYREPIPEFVLNKAIQIKKRLPSVKFYVQTLEGQPDPFLLAKVGDEHAYIEVWEEPKFEGRVR